MKDFWGNELNVWRFVWTVITAFPVLGMIYSDELNFDHYDRKILKYVAIGCAITAQLDSVYRWVKRKRREPTSDVLDEEA